MLDWLHSNLPNPIFFTLGPLTIRWYGLCIILGFFLGFLIILKLAREYRLEKKVIYDMAFYALFFGLIGDRLYYVFYAWEFYRENPLDIIKIWEGGLAIHGGIIAGLITLFLFAKFSKSQEVWKELGQKSKIAYEDKNSSLWYFLFLADLAIVVLISGLMIGRWGNYFNQELFGTPTEFAWGIPIDPINVPLDYAGETYFHPTFLYESLLDGVILIVLILLHRRRLRFLKDQCASETGQGRVRIQHFGDIALIGLSLYSMVRIFTEFFRIDYSPYVFGIRWAQIISGTIIVISLILLGLKRRHSAFKEG
jgi:phosphatidylglycerol:prolipoprotein diacylglycerol transferase